MTKYKDFSKSKVICFDVETKDPDLKTKGPAIHRDGYVLGYSFADETGFAEYYNLAHPDCSIEEKEKNLEYLAEVMSLDIPKLGQNILYDLDWIQNFLKIKVNGKLWDIMMAEALINENQLKYNLDFMAEKYLGLEKVKTDIDAFCEYHGLKGDPRQWLWQMNYSDVRDYAIGDVQLPLKIFQIQWRIMDKEELLPLFHIEMEGYPLLIRMRKHGVRINIQQIRELEDRLSDILIDYENQLYNLTGFELNYNASADIAKACDSFGLSYPLTKKTKKPSFQRSWLEANFDAHPLFGLIIRCRKYHKMISTFLESQIKHQVIDNIIYAQFHPCKAENGGTVTGRFSGSNPNLQFIPNPKSDAGIDTELDYNIGKAIRKLFLPFPEHKWGRIDFNQIELRLLAHFAIGPKSDEIRLAFNTDQKIDYHQWCADIAGVSRQEAKKPNFGLIYGMGLEKLCKELKMNLDEGEAFLRTYNAKLPFIKQTLYAVKNRAESRGYVKTILGRRRRFPNKDFTYKALNAIIQGSAADIMKKSMRDAWNAGIYDVLIPLLTVHDEMDVSIPSTKESFEAFRELNEIMMNTVKLKVPIITEMEIGENWGELGSYDPKQGELFL
ncbi:MAG: DNA polymerase [Candidatus Heimdallarchaeaceae archaeon]